MFMAPSSILFTNCVDKTASEPAPVQDMEELSKRLLGSGESLKLQVVEKDGRLFTLNNTRLQVFQWLERAGRCARVKVDRVPLRVIPKGIRDMMTVPPPEVKEHKPQSADNLHALCTTYKPTSLRKHVPDNLDISASGSDDTDNEDSGSDEDGSDAGRRSDQSDDSWEEEDSLLKRKQTSTAKYDY